MRCYICNKIMQEREVVYTRGELDPCFECKEIAHDLSNQDEEDAEADLMDIFPLSDDAS